MADHRKTSYQALVAGRKGQGKTTLVDALARGRRRVFVFDVLGEYAAKGYDPAVTMSDIKGLVRKRWKKGFHIAFRPDINSAVEQMSEMSRVICEIQRPYYDTPDGSPPPIPKVLFIVEEMRWSYPQPSPPRHQFATFCTLGRHYGVDVIGTTQRVAEISTNFRGTCDVSFFFAQAEHTDVSTIAKMIGRHHVGALQSLKPHQYLRFYGGKVAMGQNKLR